MLQRCYDEKYQNIQPTYIGCTVCDEWLYFSKFKEWFDKNYRFNLDEIGVKLELDKDLIYKDNKIYSPDTCVFIPKKVNGFMPNNRRNNISKYIGVSFHKVSNKWQAQINDFNTGERKYLGTFTHIEDASDAYIKARKIETLKAKKYLEELGYGKDIIDKLEEL